jgi:hypothetical protein
MGWINNSGEELWCLLASQMTPPLFSFASGTHSRNKMTSSANLCFAPLAKKTQMTKATHATQWPRHGIQSALLAALAAIVFGLCAQANAKPEPQPSASPCAKKRTEPYRWEGYNDKPVDACLGPHLYRIPANYFDDQMGPDFQGNFILKIMWPDLQPLPPGQRAEKNFYKEISIYPKYIDRVPIESVLERHTDSKLTYGKDSMFYDHPGYRLDLRDKQPQVFGLIPYYVNREKYEAFWEQIDRHKSPDLHLEQQRDWYLYRDAQDRLQTVIRCDSHLQPDGYVIKDGKVSRTEDETSAGCDHFFVIPEDNVEVEVGYRRVFLKDWKRIEDRAHELLARYRVK